MLRRSRWAAFAPCVLGLLRCACRCRRPTAAQAEDLEESLRTALAEVQAAEAAKGEAAAGDDEAGRGGEDASGDGGEDGGRG